jgi:hypothetical protein
MKYFLKVDYTCPNVKTGGIWIEKELDSSPSLGRGNNPHFLPAHCCQKDTYSLDCENNPDCQKQEVLAVKCLDELTTVIYDESGFSSGAGFQ